MPCNILTDSSSTLSGDAIEKPCILGYLEAQADTCYFDMNIQLHIWISSAALLFLSRLQVHRSGHRTSAPSFGKRIRKRCSTGMGVVHGAVFFFLGRNILKGEEEDIRFWSFLHVHNFEHSWATVGATALFQCQTYSYVSGKTDFPSTSELPLFREPPPWMTKGRFSGGEAGGLVQGGGQGWIGSVLPMASSIVVFDEWEVKLRIQKKISQLTSWWNLWRTPWCWKLPLRFLVSHLHVQLIR